MKSRIAIKTNENLVLQDQVTRLAREIERVGVYRFYHQAPLINLKCTLREHVRQKSMNRGFSVSIVDNFLILLDFVKIKKEKAYRSRIKENG